MDPGGVIFQYEPGVFARVLASFCASEIQLTKDWLRWIGRDGLGQQIKARDIADLIRVDHGLFWSVISFRHFDGELLRLGGLRRPEAASLHRRLNEWVTPFRESLVRQAREQIVGAEATLDGLLDGRRFVRGSDVTRVALEIREVLERVAPLVAAAFMPDDLRTKVERLRTRVASLAKDRAEANERFIKDALRRHEALFDRVESKPLTPAQRRACVINDDHNLVLAGAGTGKTSVMIGRVGYLLAERLAEPSSVLMVAYNHKAAQELRERAAARLGELAVADTLTIKTFHALGKEILADVDGVQPSVTPLAEDAAKMQGFISRLLDEALKGPEYAAKFIEYGFDLRQPYRSLFDCASMAEYERELARLNLRTLQGERVKSYEEVRIANFLVRNGVEYIYEKPFALKTADRQYRQYRPDFTISRDDPAEGPIFLEHFGVDARGNPPPYFGEQQATAYREGMEWKRQICKEHELPLVETYSYQFRPEIVFDHLEKQLAAHGVTLRPRSDAECLDMLRGSEIVTETAVLFAALVPIIREHGLGHVEIERKIAGIADNERSRARLLWELLKPLVEAYERHLATVGEIDFADMIARATDLVSTGEYRSPFTQILVDEFQDISGPRAALILALARQRSDATVFCVGDDWQSIYRFAGSDIRYTSQFDKLVGKGTTTKLDRTFRFNNQIGRVAADFVTRNPAQTRKDIASIAVVDKPAVSLIPTAEPHLGLDAILRRIDGWGLRQGKRYSAYVLARYRYELEELQAYFRSLGEGSLPNLGPVEFRTVHGVKGLEADFVVVTGLEAGRNGFPADKPSDSFHEMFLPPKESFEFAEERRLFYVALTRAKHRVYLLFDAVDHSPFVRELRKGGYPIAEGEFSGDFVQTVLPTVPCPRCATGEIRPRVGEHGVFYGCNRFPACRYRERGCGTCRSLLLRVGNYRVCSNPSCDGVHVECPKCSAPMEHRSGPYGTFFGCSNYGRVDLIEQCAATEKWRRLPAAVELRAGLERSSVGPKGLG